jgi:hypothetical protein
LRHGAQGDGKGGGELEAGSMVLDDGDGAGSWRPEGAVGGDGTSGE